MKTNTVTNLDKSPRLTINRDLETELGPLDASQLAILEEMLIRDGVTDPLKYWIAPNGKAEIIDGHNRYRIATRLHIPYQTVEVKFDKHYTITAVKYWMHKTQAGRRDGSRRLARMAELLTQLKLEVGEIKTKAAIQREVALDANTTPDAVKQAEIREGKTNEPKPAKTLSERIKTAINGEVTASEIREVIEYLSELLAQIEKPSD